MENGLKRGDNGGVERVKVKKKDIKENDEKGKTK